MNKSIKYLSILLGLALAGSASAATSGGFLDDSSYDSQPAAHHVKKGTQPPWLKNAKRTKKPAAKKAKHAKKPRVKKPAADPDAS